MAGLTEGVRGPAEVSVKAGDASSLMAAFIRIRGMQQKFCDTLLIPLEVVFFLHLQREVRSVSVVGHGPLMPLKVPDKCYLPD